MAALATMREIWSGSNNRVHVFHCHGTGTGTGWQKEKLKKKFKKKKRYCTDFEIIDLHDQKSETYFCLSLTH